MARRSVNPVLARRRQLWFQYVGLALLGLLTLVLVFLAMQK